MKQSCKFVVLVCLALAALGCSELSGPGAIVKKAFNAFQSHNSNSLTALMSRQGLANAALYCQGETINCLEMNYAGAGHALSVSTKIISQSQSQAKVELRTTWSAIQGEHCQTFTVDKTDSGWRITFFDTPQLCNP